jgi:DNA-binding CsgD family transcriptional regulator
VAGAAGGCVLLLPALGLLVAATTVKTYIGRLLTKLRVRDRVQLVIIAYRAGLIPPTDPAA